MKKILFTIAILLFSTSFFAQTIEQEKKLNKINNLINKDKIEKAESKLIDFIENNSTYGDAWDLLASIKYYHYQNASKKPNLFANMTITSQDKDGNEIEPDSSAKALLKLLSSMNPASMHYTTYLNTLKLGLAHSPSSFKSSMNLRHELRENYTDTTLQEEEIKLFNEAEKEFRSKNYNKAALLYQKALDINPQYYKALLYLGDSYYMMENYIDAIDKFEICIERFPNALEPRKYIVDSYLNEGLNKDGLKAAIESKLVYPDLILNYRMLQAADRIGKHNSLEWTERFVLPNKTFEGKFTIVKKSSGLPQFDIPKHWSIYQDALSKINEYCDSSGLISKNTSLTNSKYLEVFSWEEMLNNSTAQELETAREMQKLGYLDCYALITCFHDDFYDQYAHFVQNNKDKVIRYFNDVVLKSSDY